MASNAIKGLTVKIGGDTTQLGKALQDVEKKSRSLSGELGQINKLLKMDPGNVDLLAQKQDVLASAISTTKERLDTLKEAERQVQAQFERGEASEEQVRAIQREVIATTKKLDGYEKAAQETAEALEKLGDSSNDAGEELDDTGEEAKKAGKQVDDFGDKADKAGKSGEGLGSKLASAAKAGLAAVGAAAGAAIAGLTAAAESTREYRTAMGKLNTAFTQNGFSAEQASAAYSDLVGVLGESDQSVEAANHLAKLTSNEQELAAWTGDILPGVFATFGDSLPIEGLTEAANETAKVGQVTGPLADALNWAGVSEDAFNESLAQCSSEQERQALITSTLSSLYGDAAAAYKETNAEVIRANQANDEWMQSLSGIGAAVEPIITDVKLLGASLLSDFLPGVQQVADAVRGLLSGDTGAAASLGEALSGILTQLLTKITELAPTIVQVAMSLITTLVTTLIGMLPQLVTTGVQLIVAIINGIAQAIPQITQAIVAMIPQLVAAIVSGIPLIIQAGVDLLLALVEAIPQIIPPLVAALPDIIMALINGLLTAIPQLLEGAIQFLMAIVEAIPVIITELVPRIPEIVTTIINGLLSNLPALINGALQLLMGIIQAIPQIIVALVPQIPTIVSAIVSTLIENLPVLIEGAFQLLLGIIKAIPMIVIELGKAMPDIITGIVEGLWAGIKQVGQAALDLGKSILDSVKGFFGINSPSKLMREQGGYIVDGMAEGLEDMPDSVDGSISGAVGKVKDWGSNLVDKVQSASRSMLERAPGILKELPGKITGAISNAINNVVSWGVDMNTKAVAGMKNVASGVVNTLKELPGKVLSIGGDLVAGLWNGIGNKLTWLKNKIKSFTSSVLSSIKSFFGVHSPSTETAWIGDMLDQGLAKGVEANADKPIRAMQDVAEGVLDTATGIDGLTLERELQHSTAATVAARTNALGLAERLDKILDAIERGQILTIDGKALVGATAQEFDTQLGQRRALAARGAL